MYSQAEIEDAVAAGALAPEQAASFREFVARRNGTPTPDEEHFRLLRGFNDLFVLYACIFALVTLGWIGLLVPVGGRAGQGFGPFPVLPLFTPLLVAAGSWGLAEIFTRRRKTALPSFFLVFSFGFGVLLTLLMLIAPAVDGGEGAALLGALAAVLAAAATWGFWLRFRVPVAPSVAISLGVIAIVALVGIAFGASPAGINVISLVLLLMGMGVFAYAMHYDLSDRWRVTERSDVAFWLHWLAASLVILPLASLLGVSQGIGSAGSAIIWIVLYLVFALVALAISRKVILVVALTPLILAINNLLGRPGRAGGTGEGYGPYVQSGSPRTDLFGGTLVTVLVISLVLLLLAIFWTPLRRAVIGLVPAGLRLRLPPTELTELDHARTFE